MELPRTCKQQWFLVLAQALVCSWKPKCVTPTPQQVHAIICQFVLMWFPSCLHACCCVDISVKTCARCGMQAYQDGG